MNTVQNHSRRLLERIESRLRRARPGSVLIMVVALLVLMALIGTAYMTAARTDRFSSQQNAFNTQIDLLLQGVVNMVDGAIIGDLFSGTAQNPATYRVPSSTYTSYTTTGSTTNPLVAGATVTPQAWLGDRVPLTPAMQANPVANTPATAAGGSNPALWAFVSAPPTGTGWTFESPYVGSNPATYTNRANLQPTYIPVASGNTSVLFPAFFDPVSSATFLAADADGDGVADAGLFRLPVGEINGVTYYAAVRIIDNAAAVNASIVTAWPSETPRLPPGSFFPSCIDLNSLLINTSEAPNLTSLYRLNSSTSGTTQMPTPYDDAKNARSDFTYFNILTNLWFQLGRRLDNPGQVLRSDGMVVQYQALPPNESALMARRFILRDPSVTGLPATSPSVLEQTIPTSVLGSANNPNQYVPSSPYTDTVSWFNNNFQFVAPGTANSMPIRSLLTSRNGTSNFATGKLTSKGIFTAGTAYSFGDWVTLTQGGVAFVCIADNPGTTGYGPTDANGSLFWVQEPWSDAPTKTSANTATFGQLWAAYWSVMWDKGQSNTNAPGVPVGTETRMFRNPIRDPGTAATTQPTTQPAVAGTTLTPRQTLQLRAALAAVNTMDLRDSDNKFATGLGDVTSRNIVIAADPTVQGSSAYTATIFGGEANPYITEVYADAVGSYLAVELYNPYPFPMTLNNWQLAAVTRSASTRTVTPIPTAWIGAAAPTIPAGGYIVLVNLPTTPASASAPPSATGASLVLVPGLTAAFNNDLMLLRPRQAAGGFPLTKVVNPPSGPQLSYDETTSAVDPTSLVPVDSYDLTGLVASASTPQPAVWHYIRPNATASGMAWHFVYPGRYFTTAGVAPVTQSNTGAAATNEPRQEGTLVIDGAATMTSLASLGMPDAAALTTGFRNFPLQINNTDFGGPYKLVSPSGSTVNKFPYGGFARNGDLLQVPFIGAYTLTRISTATSQPTSVFTEITPVTMDAAFADSGEGLAAENVGRFCPMLSTDTGGVVDDYAPALATSTPPGTNPLWRYHWAMQLFDHLTVQAPHDDYFPDVDPNRYVVWNGTAYAPIATVLPVSNANPSVANAQSTNPPSSPTEDTVPVQGLININTASWKVLSCLPMVFTAGTDTVDAANNAKLAQAIVYFRDVDDGTGANPKHPHGPFTSIYELNLVPGFRTAMGTIVPTGGSLDDADGDLSPDNDPASHGTPLTSTVDGVANNFEQQFAVLNRVSNMITVRSDSFTVYIVVQGFRNAGTQAPELVVQRRAAYIVDRSGVTGNNPTNLSTLNVPVN